MSKLLEGVTPYMQQDAAVYEKLRWWPGLTLGDLLDRAADIYPEKEGFVDGKSRLTFEEARDKTNRLAISLMNIGISPQDRVLVQVPNWNEFVLAYFAVQKIGAIAVLLIDRFRQYEISHLVQLTGATSWLVSEKFKKTDYLPVVNDVVRERPQLKNVVLVRSNGYDRYLSMERLIEENAPDSENLARLAQRRPDPNMVAHMGPTGGTTGLPKLVPRTHNSLVCSIQYAALAWEVHMQDVCILVSPIGHDLTFTKGLCAVLSTLGKTVFLDAMQPEDICETIHREKATSIVLVPTIAKRLIDYEKLRDYDLSSLKKIHCGGGVSHPDLIRQVSQELKCHYLNGYGGTEGMTLLARLYYSLDQKCFTNGKPTCPYDTYKVVSPDGKTLPPDTDGELLVKGPGMFTGYYKAPAENANAFTADGFFRTGDVARIDRNGLITITGRIKEMINRGGESISATEIERLIGGHSEVALVAVIPMPDPVFGERVCAYIQPKPRASLSFEKIISYLKERKASVLQLPERIEFVEAIPLTKAQKVDKRALVEDIKRKLGLL
jgi:2,3-dihydroxybenzoate-AMP ligase/mycobactin salicyl-AMP ligase